MSYINNVKFSINIPVYNASKFINNTLDSIKNQTYKNYEVIVTNDGSTDDTEKLLEKYKRSNPEFPLDFATQKNSGVSIARNNGISRASGNYIAFLDQDDWWFPYKLERVAEILKRNINIDVLYHEAVLVGWKKGNSFLKLGALKDPIFLDLLFNGSKIGISTAVVKLDKLVDVGGFSLKYVYSEDYDLWLRLAKKGVNFYYIPEFLSKYILLESSESNKVENMTKEKLEIFEYNFRVIVTEAEYDNKYLYKKYKRGKSIILFGASRRFYFLNDYKKAMDYSIQAIKTDQGFWKSYIGLILSYLKIKLHINTKNKKLYKD